MTYFCAICYRGAIDAGKTKDEARAAAFAEPAPFGFRLPVNLRTGERDGGTIHTCRQHREAGQAIMDEAKAKARGF